MNSNANFTSATSATFQISQTWYFPVAFFIWLAIYTLISLVAFKGDNIIGLARTMHKTSKPPQKIIQLTMGLLAACSYIIPLGIAAAWGYVAYTQVSLTILVALLLGLIFLTFMTYGLIQWSGTQFLDFSWPVAVYFLIALLSCWIFSLIVSVGKPDQFNFTSCSATLFTINFIPVCFLVYQRTLWNDISLRHMTEEITKQITSVKTLSEEDANNKLDEILDANLAVSTKSLKWRFFIASIFYLVPLAAYVYLINVNQPVSQKGLSVSNPIFIILTDLVILSLQEPQDKRGTSFTYYSSFQSVYLLCVRFLLCFIPTFWVIMQSVCYFTTTLLAFYDMSQRFIECQKLTSDIQKDVLNLYEDLPLIKVLVKTKLPELRFKFEKKSRSCKGLQCLATLLTSTLLSVCMAVLIYFSISNYKYLNSPNIAFDSQTTVNQSMYAVTASCLSWILGMLIFWYKYIKAYSKASLQEKFVTDEAEQAKNKKCCAFDAKGFFIFLLIWIVSIGLAVGHNQLMPKQVALIYTLYISLPIIVGTFLAFFHNWEENDYNAFERPKDAQDFDSCKLLLDKTKPNSQKCVWQKPKTQRDWMSIVLITVNLVSIAAFIVLTCQYSGPIYIGLLIGIGFLLAESAVLQVVKYRETNFSPWNNLPAVTLIVATLLLVGGFICTAWFCVFGQKTTQVSDAMQGIILAVFILLVLVWLSSMLYVEYTSKKNDLKAVSRNFYCLVVVLLLCLLSFGVWIFMKDNKAVAVLYWIFVFYGIFVAFFQRAKFVINLVLSIILLAMGLCLIFVKQVVVYTTTLLTITILILAFLALMFAVYEKLEENTSAGDFKMYSETVLPEFRFNYKDQKFTSSSNPLIIFIVAITVNLWSFIVIIFANMTDVYIPILVMDFSSVLFITWLFHIQINSATADHVKFRQASMLLFASTITQSIDMKIKWRADDSVKPKGVQQQLPKSNQPTMTDEQCVQEILRWSQIKDDLKSVQCFLNVFQPKDKVIFELEPSTSLIKTDFTMNDSIDPLKKTDNPDQPIVNEVVVVDVSSSLVSQWLQFKENELIEKMLDVKCFSFLNYTLNEKMNVIVDQQLSLIEATINILNEKQQNGRNDSISTFVRALKADDKFKMSATQFLAGQICESLKQKLGDQALNQGVGKQLKDLVDQAQIDFQNSPIAFNFDNFKEGQIGLIQQIMVESSEAMNTMLENQVKRDIEREQLRIIALKELENKKKEYGLDSDISKQIGDEDQFLTEEGNKIISKFGGKGLYTDNDFQFAKASGKKFDNFKFERLTNIIQARSGFTKGVVFQEGINSSDILQGSLGDCWYLSAIATVAHSRPDLIKKLVHFECREELRNDGLFVMFYWVLGRPQLVWIDDNIVSQPNEPKEILVNVAQNKKTGVCEVWSLLFEKSFAKLFGSFANMDGGLISTGLQYLTDGITIEVVLKDEVVKAQISSGAFWSNLTKMIESREYLFGASSPSGSDKDKSTLGIVLGHAYSLLDATIVDGIKLVQLRNPWGESEWKGAWSDDSKEWTEKRKKMVVERQQKFAAHDVIQVAGNDGVFWMSFNDFVVNFRALTTCRLLRFDKNWTFQSWTGELSNALGNNANYEGHNGTDFSKSPQKRLVIEGNAQIVLRLRMQDNSKPQDQILQVLRICNNKGEKLGENVFGIEAIDDVRSYGECLSEKTLPSVPGGYSLIILPWQDTKLEGQFSVQLFCKKGTGSASLVDFNNP